MNRDTRHGISIIIAIFMASFSAYCGDEIHGPGNLDNNNRGNGNPAFQSESLKVVVPDHYLDWLPPEAGGSYIDPAFGTRITRLTDGLKDFDLPVHHEYATMSPFNKDDSKIMLLADGKGFYVVDIKGKVVVEPEVIGLDGSAEPRWSVADPDTFYFHGFESNEIKSFDIKARKKSVVHKLTEFKKINFGGGESDISEDGDHIIIIGDDRHVGLFNLKEKSIGKTLNVEGLGGFDYFDVTPNNNVIVRWNAQGQGRYKGFELFDRNMNFIRQVYPYGAHSDRGRDLNGDEVLVVLAATDQSPPPGCENNGIEKVRLKDGQKTCLLPLNWDVGTHISANTNGRNPWVLVETTEERYGMAKPNNGLPADWKQNWKPFYNEVLLIKIDGSEVRRLAHHRSRSFDDYWFTPRPAISRDGAFAVFDSNFNSNPVKDYTDVFLINLASDQIKQ